MSVQDLVSPVHAPPGRAPLRMHTETLRLDALALDFGGLLENVDVGFTLYGDPRLPLVVVLGGISAGRDIARSPGTLPPGWWQDFVGKGLAVDTRSFSVLGVDFLGGAGASTGPEGPGFPVIGTGDQAGAVAAVLDHLGLGRVHALVGASYGGMAALAFAARFGERLDRLVVISAAHESHPMATALRTLQRRAIRMGLESGRVEEGLAIARGIAMTSYRTAEEFAGRFDPTPCAAAEGFRFPVEEYLEYKGAAFARRFPPWSFLCLSESLDLHRVDPSLIRTPATLIGVDSDTLVPPWQMRSLAKALGGHTRSFGIQSIYGHDAFLKEVGAVTDIIRESLGTGGNHDA